MFFARRLGSQPRRRRRRGVTSTEYAVMLALMLGVAMTAINCLGRSTQQTFQRTRNAIPSGSSSSGS
jgi:Flp pilus assembly pilin Flp